MTKFFKDNLINVLDWSGHSLDLNPIENMRDIVKSHCTMKTKLIEAIIQVWYHDEEIGGLFAISCERTAKELWKTYQLLISIICNDMK